MAQRSRFFDSSGGDRVYTSDAWAQVVAALQGDGVVPGIGNELQVHESSPAAMSVRVKTGIAFIQGYYLEAYTAEETLVLSAAHATNPRIDYIVARRSLTNREATLTVLEGTPAASPAAPTLTQVAAGTYEIPLATVYVAALASSVSDASITDQRGARSKGYDLAAALHATTGHTHTGATANAPAIAYSAISGKPSTFVPSDHTHVGVGTGGTVAYSALSGVPATFTPSSHTHVGVGTGGTVSYTVLTDKPASFNAAAHAISPASGYHTGTLDWAYVSGRPTTFTPIDHALGTAGGYHTGTLPWSDLSSVPSTFAPTAHATAHKTGGGDPITAAEIGGFLRYATVGTVGSKVYVGTTTPVSPAAAEGDIWIKG